ncbi:MAG TPA: hypothetical protein VJ907_08120 [Halanaerobiales bacterium]|nr:hypothetical protein [Halanaerobiales bacterium]
MLNTARIIAGYAKDASNVIFYYKELGHRREITSKYEAELTMSEFDALFDETLTNERIIIPVTEIYNPDKQVESISLNIGVSDIIKGIDIDTSSCWLWYARGMFRSVKLKVSSTIAEIETASSGSVEDIT